MSTDNWSNVDVASLIDRDALIELTLDICNIDSAGPTEGQAAERVATWMTEAGFGVRRIGLLADRYNVLGTWRGTGGGYSLIFNSHLDTAVRRYETLRVLEPDADIHHKAWRDGDELVGEGVVNDKGPMAAFLIAAKSLKQVGIKLKGDVCFCRDRRNKPRAERRPTGRNARDAGSRNAFPNYAWRRG